MNPLDPSVSLFCGGCFIVWFAGFCIGLLMRNFRQIIEKATRM